jgi:hypothetical protein
MRAYAECIDFVRGLTTSRMHRPQVGAGNRSASKQRAVSRFNVDAGLKFDADLRECVTDAK